jgi:glycosyltransferase involved in cell wall biosynthesis
LIASLNKGLALCEGKYIARIDADDVALPQRLEKQVEFLEKKCEIGVLGTFAETIGLEKNYQIEFLTNHENIRLKLFFNNYLHHPTVMLRKDILLQNNIQYESCLHAEDYLLWLRLSKVTKIDILPEILLKYRMHEENISNVHQEFQKKQTHELRKLQLNELGLFPEESVLEIYNFFIDEHKLQSFSDFEILIEFIQNVIQENKRNPILNEHLLFNFFKGKIKDFVELNCWERELKVKIYFKSIFAESKLNNVKIYIKNILRIKKIK